MKNLKKKNEMGKRGGLGEEILNGLIGLPNNIDLLPIYTHIQKLKIPISIYSWTDMNKFNQMG